ncbi:MAG: NADH-quinone oxidoreductase subunit M [Acidobacteria bacterium]|nr:MAG: NADH-quinone oxidoreductase subunit M [Acidobacteriota bacterium]
MDQALAGVPVLSLITFLPLAVAVVVMLVPRERPRLIHQVATWGSLLTFVVSVLPLLAWDFTDGGFQFVETHAWIPSLGVQYKLGVDGVSMLLVVLTTLLTFISLLSSWSAIESRVKEYCVYFLLLEVGMLGVFVALDLFLFYVFWEVMLVPMYFIIGIWGGPRRIYAAVKFFLYTLAGSVLMLIGIIALYFYSGQVLGERTFDIVRLHELGALTADWSWAFWVFMALFVGFAIKVPMFPFHTWLPDAHVEAPTAGSVILAGVLLKMGTYGFFRLSVPIFPVETARNLPWLLGLCMVGVIYGALVAFAQQDWKKLVAYSSVSHLGITMAGLFALNIAGVKGSVLQMINHGISSGALFLIVGIVYERRHTRLISEYGGLARVMPVFAVFFMVMMLSSAGLPLLNGFVGELTILAGLSQVGGAVYSFFGASPLWWTVLGATGVVLGAAYLLLLYQRTMFGEVTNRKNENLPDMSWRERWTLIPLVALAVWIGVYPWTFFAYLEAPVRRLVDEQVVPALEQAELDVLLPEGTDVATGSAARLPDEPAEAPAASHAGRTDAGGRPAADAH